MAGPTGRHPAAAAGVGIASGLVSGLLGVGGGIVLVPGLMLLRMPQRRAIANSLLAIIPISVAGVAVYYLASDRHAVRFDLALLLAIGSTAGAPLGAAIVYRVPERALRIGLGVLALLVAIRLLVP